MAYGQVIYRGRQVHLFGRWHIDGCNAMLFHEYGLEGVYELARVTALAGQVVARVSPGSGISAMQMVTALRLGIMVPWHKQQAERPKSALEMMQADQGGLVYQPLIGLHRDVAEVDFISMYPSIMRHFNISPETVADPNAKGRDQYARLERVSELGLWIDQDTSGLIPQTLAPLLDKRLELKLRLADLPAWDPRRQTYQAQATAHKWLLVTCFGYLGYKNARFGRIEAHEAVTAYGREMLLRAKEAAEDLGFTVLHMYVDGLWVKKKGLAEVPRLPAAAGGDHRPHRAADCPGWHLPLGGVPALAHGRARAGAQPLFWGFPGWQPEDARHRGPPPRHAHLGVGCADGDHRHPGAYLQRG